MVDTEPNPIIRVAALDALVDLLGGCAYPLLKRLLNDKQPMVRLRAQAWLLSQVDEQVGDNQQRDDAPEDRFDCVHRSR
ncbi:MAG: hypothetical protein KatS3mg020_0744 [Fimbriimonadales bacterium]|nr:MAG: hypothetical protein KatS3mg020_0744 [Fimbriimonadales bacterium]